MTVNLNPNERQAFAALQELHKNLGIVLNAFREKAEDDPVTSRLDEMLNSGQISSVRRFRIPEVRDPEWFIPGNRNRHLTEKGIAHLRGLYDQGLKYREAAQSMGINPSAALYRYDQWKKGE